MSFFATENCGPYLLMILNVDMQHNEALWKQKYKLVFLDINYLIYKMYAVAD